MRPVVDEEALAEIRSSATGFLFNDFAPTGDPAYNVLHWTGCRELARMNMGVPKIYFETLDEAEDFLNRARGPENIGWKKCGTCAASAPAVFEESYVDSQRPVDAATRDLEGVLDETGSRFAVRGGSDGIEAWAERRLQFEPRGWQISLRESLRGAIANLEVTDGEILHASYLSPLAADCDAENAVIYNLGASCFRRPARHGLRFERGFGPVPQPPADTPAADHYYRYEGSDRADDFRYWLRGADVCEIETEGCGPLSETTKVASVWHAVKAGRVATREPLPGSGLFALSVSLCSPEISSSNPAAIIKPLFDGVISALHFHDDAGVDEIAARIAPGLGLNSEDAAALLVDSSSAVLGGRRLAWPWREGVQWNPDDGRCVAGELLLAPASQEASPWSFRASLCSIASPVAA